MPHKVDFFLSSVLELWQNDSLVFNATAGNDDLVHWLIMPPSYSFWCFHTMSMDDANHHLDSLDPQQHWDWRPLPDSVVVQARGRGVVNASQRRRLWIRPVSALQTQPGISQAQCHVFLCKQRVVGGGGGGGWGGRGAALCIRDLWLCLASLGRGRTVAMETDCQNI